MTDRCSPLTRAPVRCPFSTVRPSRRLAFLLTISLLMAGCSVLPGGTEEPGAATDAKVPALSPVGWKSVDRDQVAPGGTLRLAAAALPKNFNPQHASNGESEAGRLLEPTVGSAVRVTADGGWEVDSDYARAVKIVDTAGIRQLIFFNDIATLFVYDFFHGK